MTNMNTQFSNDVALCLNPVNITLCAASYQPDGQLNLVHFPIDEDLFDNLSEWRESFGYKTDAHTIYRFVPSLFMEQTRVLAAPDSLLTLTDSDLLEWLIESANGNAMGTDGRPLFEFALSASAYDFTRLPNNLLSLTEHSRENLELTQKTFLPAMQSLNADQLTAQVFLRPEFPTPAALQSIETKLRAITRHLSISDGEFFARLSGNETIAVFTFTPDGVGFALWNPENGLFLELGELFDLKVADELIPPGMDIGSFLGQMYSESVLNFLTEQFYQRILPEDESQAAINVKRIYWTATSNLFAPLAFVLNDFAEQIALPFVQISEPVEEIIVSGLLLGTSDETTVLVPAINLANDIAQQHQAVLDEKLEVRHDHSRARRRLAVVCLLLPVACAFGLVIGLIVNNWRITAALDTRTFDATAEKARLQPKITNRAALEGSQKWFADLMGQIFGLRKMQGAALSFAARLDPLFPRTADFFVSDLKIMPGGNFELKGLARDEYAVSQFARSIELPLEADTEKKYFSGVSVEFKQGSRISDKPASGGTLNGSLPPGISAFQVKGNFAPASGIKAQEAKPAGAPPAGQPPPTPATTTAAPVNPNQPPTGSQVIVNGAKQ
ncbi:MAG: hypothetical protein LH472_04765 [Pyrinomonadaceae bacterium]|nr:hypothetical protein [Pyrinomonadaceae bacterium]